MEQLIGCKAIFSTNQDKLEILKSLSENSVFLNVKYMDPTKPLSRFSPNYLLYMKNQYQIPYDLAKSLQPIFDYIDVKKIYSTDKLNQLKEIKVDLIKQKIMKEFNAHNLKNGKIAVINQIPIPDYLKKSQIVEYEFKKVVTSNIKLLTSKTQKESIYAVYEEVVRLLENHTNINDIVILNTTDNDDFMLEKLFMDAMIPIQINKAINIQSYPVVIKLLDILEREGYLASKDYFTQQQQSNHNQEVLLALLSIYNQYFDEDLKQNPEFLAYQIQNKSIKAKPLKNCIHVYDIDDVIYEQDKIYLLMNYTDQSLPKSYQKTAYLTSSEYKEIDYVTDEVMQDFIRKHYSDMLNRINHLVLFFAQVSEEEQRICNLSLKREIIEKNYSYKIADVSYLSSMNQLEFAKAKYNYNTFHLMSDNYQSLYRSFNDLVVPYHHEFTGIHNEDLNVLLRRHPSLTGAKLETYSLCQFQFLMTYLLQIYPNEENINLYLGNLSHKILEEITKNPNADYHKMIDDFNGFPEQEIHKESVFKQAIKDEMDHLVPIVKTFHETTSFQMIQPETKFSFDFKENPRFKITGTIDKMMVFQDANKVNYVVFVDYKLSTKDFKVDAFYKNQQFQLPVYLYAYKNLHKGSIQPIGLYYQTTTLGRYYNDDGVVEKNFQLSGISLEDKDHLLKLSPDLEQIRGISVTKNESLSDRKSGRLQTKDDFKKILDYVEKAFLDMANKLEMGQFNINPLPSYGSKQDSISCEYCNYASICFNKNKKLGVEE